MALLPMSLNQNQSITETVTGETWVNENSICNN